MQNFRHANHYFDEGRTRRHMTVDIVISAEDDVELQEIRTNLVDTIADFCDGLDETQNGLSDG